jgi:DNA mismatch repair ATPase MutS
MLGLKVTVKKGDSDKEPDMLVAGLPDYAIHKWAARLTQLGWTVVIVDQVKNAVGKVARREVQRILTPGSHVEAAVDRQDMYLTFVALRSANALTPTIALTAIDLTTGHLHVFETQAQGTQEAWTSNDTVQFMELYPPREVLWSLTGSQRFSDISETKLKSILGCPIGTTFHRRDALTTGAWTKPDFRETFLKEQCSLKSLLPTHVALHLAPGSRKPSSDQETLDNWELYQSDHQVEHRFQG